MILLAVSGIIIVIGVTIFAFSKSRGSTDGGTVIMWGTLSDDNFTELKNFLDSEKRIEQKIEYVFVEPSLFDSKLTTALAEGTGPDLILLTEDKIIKHQKKLFQVSYEFFPERTFKDTFIESGETFTDQKGVYGFPFLVDPMVMYWNRSIFTQNGVSQPPRYWDELLTLVPKLVEIDTNLAINKSAVAMGDYANINHAKELLTTLLIQAGNPIVSKNLTEATNLDEYTVVFDDKFNYTVAPAQAAVNFYTQFANPARTVYSWNRSLSNSMDAFIAGDVAMYFGFASEFATIRQKNPNLNFDVSVVPQSRSGNSATYGKVLALAIPKTTPNADRSFALIQNLIAADTISFISDVVFLPPVRRDLLAGNPDNAFMQTFHDSALISKNVYDFNPEETDKIFKSLIESVVSGRLTTSEAIVRANGELELLKQ